MTGHPTGPDDDTQPRDPRDVARLLPPPRLASLRVGDADRDAAAHDLRQHYTDGRLTLEEFLHRLPLVLQARTAADLAPLFADLPAPADPRSAAPRRPRRTSSPRRILVAAAAADAIAAASWTAAPTRPPTRPHSRGTTAASAPTRDPEQLSSPSPRGRSTSAWSATDPS